MTVPVIVLPDAERDLAEAFAWYEEQKPGLGRASLDAVETLFGHVGEFPHTFPATDDAMRRGLLKRFPFAVYFLADTMGVKVYAVLHHRREPGIWKQRLGL